jgi:hypothetical protein
MLFREKEREMKNYWNSFWTGFKSGYEEALSEFTEDELKQVYLGWIIILGSFLLGWFFGASFISVF